MYKFLTYILLFFVPVFAQAQKSDSVQKAPGNVLEAKYNKCVQAADDDYKNKDYANAKTHYQNALNLKPEEKYPKDQIKKIDCLIVNCEECEVNIKYKRFIY